MSQLTKETVKRIAELSKLRFNDQEEDQILADLNRMLTFVEKLNELDTEGVEPLVYMTEERNVFRKDELIQRISHEEALKNAPQKDAGPVGLELLNDANQIFIDFSRFF